MCHAATSPAAAPFGDGLPGQGRFSELSADEATFKEVMNYGLHVLVLVYCPSDEQTCAIKSALEHGRWTTSAISRNDRGIQTVTTSPWTLLAR